MSDTSIDRQHSRPDARNRKAVPGVFALRCRPTRQIWVEASPNLDATRNGLWFFLSNGLHRDPVLQQAWRVHGEQAFQYDVLELVGADVPPPAVPDCLKALRETWATKFKALPIRL